MTILQRQILKVVDNWSIISTSLATLHHLHHYPPEIRKCLMENPTRTTCNFDDVDVDPLCGWQQDFRCLEANPASTNPTTRMLYSVCARL